MTDGSRDVLRTFAWLCVFAGVLIAIGTHAYLSHRQAAISLEMSRLRSQTYVPHTVEHRRYEVLRAEFQRLSRWPWIVGGAGVTAVGILLLVSPRWWRRDAEKYDIGRVAIMAVLGAGTLLSAGLFSFLIILGLSHGSSGLDPFSGLLILITLGATLAMPFVMFAVRKHSGARYSLIGICLLVSAAWGWLWVTDSSLMSWHINAAGLAVPLIFGVMLFRGRDRPVYENW
jgi:hypothetical protein